MTVVVEGDVPVQVSPWMLPFRSDLWIHVFNPSLRVTVRSGLLYVIETEPDGPGEIATVPAVGRPDASHAA